MLFVEKYNVKSNWWKRKKLWSVGVWKNLKVYSNVTLVFLTSLSSKFQQRNVIHNLPRHDLSMDRENKVQWFFLYERSMRNIYPLFFLKMIFALLETDMCGYHFLNKLLQRFFETVSEDKLCYFTCCVTRECV